MTWFTDPAESAPPTMPSDAQIRKLLTLPKQEPAQPANNVPKKPPAKKIPLMAPRITRVCEYPGEMGLGSSDNDSQKLGSPNVAPTTAKLYPVYTEPEAANKIACKR